jgi:uncharacterized membrane protein
MGPGNILCGSTGTKLSAAGVNMTRKILIRTLALVALTIGLALPGAARADLKFCNHTTQQVTVAIGYSADGEWTSEGWWTVDPNQCKTPIGDALKNRYYYYYAESDSNKWDGDYIFCTQDKKFTIVGDKDCKSRGYAPEQFREIDVGEAASKEIDFTEN